MENVLCPSNNKRQAFLDSLAFRENEDYKQLLSLQSKLETMGINNLNAHILTEKLTDKQKQDLISLYLAQINDNEQRINNYKNRIIKIKKSQKRPY